MHDPDENDSPLPVTLKACKAEILALRAQLHKQNLHWAEVFGADESRRRRERSQALYEAQKAARLTGVLK